MRTHHPHPDRTDRARCGTPVTNVDRLRPGPDGPSCRRCRTAEAEHARRFGLLRWALERAIADATWLRAADGASIELARNLADHLDTATFAPADHVAAARQLTNLYRALGLSPDGRPEHLDRPEPAASPLAALRDRNAAPLEAVDG